MQTFKEFNDTELDAQIQETIITMVLVRESNSQELYEAFDQDQDILINEGIMDILKMDVKSVAKNLSGVLSKGLNKSGLQISKGKGLIHYIMSAGKGVGKMMLALMKGDTDTVKEIAKTVKKEDVIAFLMKLDTVTMHMFGGPIHTLDAITGWKIGPNLLNAIRGKEGIISKIKQAMDTIRNSVSDLMDKTRSVVFKKGIDKLEAELG